MAKPKIVIFSGPRSTIANSPTLVTGNKGRLEGERQLPGRYEHLVAQTLFEPVDNGLNERARRVGVEVIRCQSV